MRVPGPSHQQVPPCSKRAHVGALFAANDCGVLQGSLDPQPDDDGKSTTRRLHREGLPDLPQSTRQSITLSCDAALLASQPRGPQRLRVLELPGHTLHHKHHTANIQV